MAQQQQQQQPPRHFANTLDDDADAAAADDDAGQQQQLLLAAAAALLKDVKHAALAHRDVSGGGVYVGVAGPALLYLRLARRVRGRGRYAAPPYLRKHTEPHCLKIAAELLREAEQLISERRVTFLEGTPGVLCLQAELARLQGDAEGAAARLRQLAAMWEVVQQLPASECDLLYGRAGYLYALCWARAHVCGSSGSGGSGGHDDEGGGHGQQQPLAAQALLPDALLRGVARAILDEGLACAAAAEGCGSRWPLMWRWHRKAYLGFAHGVAGVVYVLLSCLPVVRALDAEQPRRGYLQALRGTADALCAAQLASGNLPTKLGDREDVRVAWCHGAAGLVLALLKAAEAFGGRDGGGGGGGGGDGGRYLAAAARAGDDLWRRGLLTKGVGLCHGASGNGYALLALARQARGGDDGGAAAAVWRRRARLFAAFVAQRWQELRDVPDRPASLYEGLAGAACFLLDAAAADEGGKDGALFPGAELPWMDA